MPQTSRAIADGPGWRVTDVVCTDGPHDRRFEETHDCVSIAMVLRGSFQYRSAHGEALLAPGTLLTGNPGQCFECGHEHGTGDHCLSFQLAPGYAERILKDVPGARRLSFQRPKLPPSPQLISLMAEAVAASHHADPHALEEITVRLAAYAASRQTATAPALRIAPKEYRIVGEALRRIEAKLSELDDDALSLAALSGHFAISPYRFLRLFRRMVGMTPHQYVLNLRLSHAAARLLTGNEEVSIIAFGAGFGDLSTFNHRFRAVLGKTPTRFRAQC